MALQADENFQAIAVEWLEKKKVDCAKSTYISIEGVLKNHVPKFDIKNAARS